MTCGALHDQSPHFVVQVGVIVVVKGVMNTLDNDRPRPGVYSARPSGIDFLPHDLFLLSFTYFHVHQSYLVPEPEL